MLVSEVHPVAIRRAEFWMVWSFWMLVSEMMEDQMGLAYSITERVMAL